MSKRDTDGSGSEAEDAFEPLTVVALAAAKDEARDLLTPVSLTTRAINCCLFIYAAALTISDSIALSSVASFAAGGWPKSRSGCSTATSGMIPFSWIATLAGVR